MNAYILSAKRTPIGAFLGGLSTVPAPHLGAMAIQAVLKESAVPVEDVHECVIGQVLTAGCGQSPARQSAIYAGLKVATPCMTINKVCGSGLKALMLACDLIALKRADAVIAGGQENMSLTPYLLPKVRKGWRLGDQKALDSMVTDGLWDPYHNFHMGVAGEMCAKKHQISRKSQDEYATHSYKKAQIALKSGYFDKELTAVTCQVGKKTITVKTDEEPGKVIFDKIPHLSPVFEKDGTITPANASKISDGAAMCLVVSDKYLQSTKKKPLARIVAQSVFAQEPENFTTAPVQAIKKILHLTNKKISDIDLFEINEAFCVVAQVAQKKLGIPPEKLNVHGGAVALGHPIGASGARILVTLVHALHRYNKKYGVAAICLGGGEAVAVLVEKQ